VNGFQTERQGAGFVVVESFLIEKEKGQSASVGVLYLGVYWTMYGQQSG
jgi:hypothetical protein|tara:strand:- start:6 stop:152 length:147 start_codon:yes stop_codon:yes gene_type:complete